MVQTHLSMNSTLLRFYYVTMQSSVVVFAYDCSTTIIEADLWRSLSIRNVNYQKRNKQTKIQYFLIFFHIWIMICAR